MPCQCWHVGQPGSWSGSLSPKIEGLSIYTARASRHGGPAKFRQVLRQERCQCLAALCVPRASPPPLGDGEGWAGAAPPPVPATLSPRADGALSRSEAQPRSERGEGPCVPEQRELEQRELPPDTCAGEAPAGSQGSAGSPHPRCLPPRVSPTPLLVPGMSQPPRAQFSSCGQTARHCTARGHCE